MGKEKRNLRFKKIVLFLSLLFSVGTTFSQSLVNGKVTDQQGQPLIGAAVIVEGTEEGTSTDYKGEFSFKTRKTLKSEKIRISYVGFHNQLVTFTGKFLNIALKDNSVELENVVVTALGIKREEKGLGYSTRKVEGSQLSETNPVNWSSALNGKIAGLNVLSPGGPLSSTRISLRGDVSLNMNGNNALIIVDGVPMSSPQSNPGTAYGAGSSAELSVDYGNGFSDINPNDIENIQVLKGASASALYGTRAANGVILITTKSGSNAKKGIGVTFSSSYSTDEVMHFPDYQYEFGQGLPTNIGKAGTEFAGKQYYSYGTSPDGNSSTSGTSSAYGAPFNADQLYYQYDPTLQGRATEATQFHTF